MAIDEVSIEKYLQAITTINSTLGRLDVLKLHVKSTYNDKVADVILESVIKELSNVCGVSYKTIDLKINEPIQPVSNTTKQIIQEKNQNIGYTAPVTPVTIEVIEDNNHVYSDETIKPSVNIADATIQAEKKNKVNKTSKQNKKPVVNNDVVNTGVQYDNQTGKYTYSFINSNTLAYMIYEKFTKQMIITFKKNGRTYLYKNVPNYIMDNLISIDESGASAGAYFQQNIAKKWTRGQYKEITNEEFIG